MSERRESVGQTVGGKKRDKNEIIKWDYSAVKAVWTSAKGLRLSSPVAEVQGWTQRHPKQG